MNWIKSIIEDNSGGSSSTRILMLTWGVGVFIVWAYISLHTGILTPLPETVITVLLGTSAMKVVQRYGEKPENEKNETK